MPIWPGSPGVHIKWLSDKSKGDFASGSKIEMDLHCGTHIDAPLHHIPGAKTSLEISLAKLNGPCMVLDCGEHKVISAEMLESRANEIGHSSRILFKTQNSALWANPYHSFKSDYCALDASAAKWIADRHLSLVGIDYLSIQLFKDPPLTHEILLAAEVVILETINLTNVEEGRYELLCLPVKIEGVEAASCRALLKKLS